MRSGFAGDWQLKHELLDVRPACIEFVSTARHCPNRLGSCCSLKLLIYPTPCMQEAGSCAAPLVSR